MAKKTTTETTAEDPKTTALENVAPPGALVEYDYGDDEGAGFEHQTAADVSIPFIILLQALTPSVVERTDPMAMSGNMYNTVTERYYDRDKGFLFVPATTRHVYVKWVPRDKGGGFRGHLMPEDPIVQKAIKDSLKFGKYTMTEGDELLQLVETFYVYGAICDENGGAEGMALIAFTSSKIKPYKKWITKLRDLRIPRPNGKPPIKPPLYGNLCRMTAFGTKNTKGQPYFNFAVGPGDPRGLTSSLLHGDDPRFLLAKACGELVDSGQAKVDFEKQDGPSTEEDGGTAAF